MLQLPLLKLLVHYSFISTCQWLDLHNSSISGSQNYLSLTQPSFDSHNGLFFSDSFLDNLHSVLKMFAKFFQFCNYKILSNWKYTAAYPPLTANNQLLPTPLLFQCYRFIRTLFVLTLAIFLTSLLITHMCMMYIFFSSWYWQLELHFCVSSLWHITGDQMQA